MPSPTSFVSRSKSWMRAVLSLANSTNSVMMRCNSSGSMATPGVGAPNGRERLHVGGFGASFGYSESGGQRDSSSCVQVRALWAASLGSASALLAALPTLLRNYSGGVLL